MSKKIEAKKVDGFDGKYLDTAMDFPLSEIAISNCNRCYGTGREGFIYKGDKKLALLCTGKGCALDMLKAMRLRYMIELQRKKKEEEAKLKEKEKENEQNTEA